jgi:outer membrane protein assembly factor BamB
MIIRCRETTLAGALLLAAALPTLAGGREATHWPQFRGPGARGVAENARVPDRWSATENVLWRHDVPGRGWSSPIVWGNRVFLTTVVNSGETEAASKGLYFGGERPDPPAAPHEWRILCFDLVSGKVRWERTVHRGIPATGRHIKNSYASETPVTDGRRLYVLFGNLGLYCLDMDGRMVWSRRIEPRPTRYGWGTAASPVLHRERLYLVNDNEERSYLLALDAKTGKEAWRVDRDEKSNWSTPFVWEHSGGAEIVTSGTGKVRSYDLNGRLLWWLEGMSSITIATPYAAGGLLYVSSGYVGSQLRPLYAIRPGGRGDISLKQDQRSGPFVAWCDWKGAPYNPSTLVHGGRLYVLHDRSMISAYDAVTGAPLYDRERIPGAAGFTASPWAWGDRIFALDEDGVTFVFRAGPRFELLHRNRLADDDMGMATPAIAGDRLLIRTAARIYCIGGPRSP